MAWGFAYPVVALILVGCAKTSIISRTSPEYQGRSYNNFLVIGSFDDWEFQEICEKRIARVLNHRLVNVMQGREVLFPGMLQNDEDYHNFLSNRAIHAVLIVYITAAGYNVNYIPPVTSVKTSGEAQTTGAYTRYSSESTIRSYGGGDVDKPWANYRAELYDTRSGKLVWYANVKARGNFLASHKSLVSATTEKILDKLTVDGFIPERF